jgi:hypothetical protein
VTGRTSGVTMSTIGSRVPLALIEPPSASTPGM